MNRIEKALRLGLATLTVGAAVAVAPVISRAEVPSSGSGNRVTLLVPEGCNCENAFLVGNTLVGFVGSDGYSHYQCECPEPRQETYSDSLGALRVLRDSEDCR